MGPRSIQEGDNCGSKGEDTGPWARPDTPSPLSAFNSCKRNDGTFLDMPETCSCSRECEVLLCGALKLEDDEKRRSEMGSGQQSEVIPNLNFPCQPGIQIRQQQIRRLPGVTDGGKWSGGLAADCGAEMCAFLRDGCRFVGAHAWRIWPPFHEVSIQPFSRLKDRWEDVSRSNPFSPEVS